jgi:predicted transcriptional regulator
MQIGGRFFIFIGNIITMTATQLKTELKKIAGKLPKSKLETVVAYANLISSKQDFYLELSDEDKAGIEEGLEDIKYGRVQTFEESMVKYKKFRKKKK